MIDEMNDLVKRVKNCHIIGIILRKTQVVIAVLFLRFSFRTTLLNEY